MTERLGPYRLDEVVATRGLWATYRATHERLERRVRVKALRPALQATDAHRSELGREAAALARLTHGVFVRLLEAHEDAARPHLVLEEPEGYTFRRLLERGPIDPDGALALVLTLAEALGHLHTFGLAHGDVSLANGTVGADGTVRFVGPLAPPEPGEGGHLAFEAGESFAHPEGMAPEQTRGAAPSAASDVFALGALAYTLLTGDHPFAAKEPRETVQRIRAASPKPLPTTVPRSFVRVVERCLAREASDRFADGEAVATALDGVLAERTLDSAPVLIARCLERAGLGAARPSRGGSAPARNPPNRWLGRTMAQNLALGLGSALVSIGIAWWSHAGDAGSAATAGPPGALRVLASPWAEVSIDGETYDVTPIGKPIPLSAGEHHVTFRHPSAPDEDRVVQVASGQTVLLDVTMRLPAREPTNTRRVDAGPESP